MFLEVEFKRFIKGFSVGSESFWFVERGLGGENFFLEDFFIRFIVCLGIYFIALRGRSYIVFFYKRNEVLKLEDFNEEIR